MKATKKIQAIIALLAMSTTLAFANETSVETTEENTGTEIVTEETTETLDQETEEEVLENEVLDEVSEEMTTEEETLGEEVETEVDMVNEEVSEDFSLTDIEVTSETEVVLSFNNDLMKDTSILDFAVSDSQLEEVVILEKELVETNQVKLILETPLTNGANYSVTVLFAADIDSNYIENGVNGQADFMVPETFEVEVMEAAVEEVKEPTLEEKCAADPELEECKVAFGETEEEIVEVEAEKLPNTWAAETIVVLFSILAASGLMFIKRKA